MGSPRGASWIGPPPITRQQDSNLQPRWWLTTPPLPIYFSQVAEVLTIKLLLSFQNNWCYLQRALYKNTFTEKKSCFIRMWRTWCTIIKNKQPQSQAYFSWPAFVWKWGFEVQILERLLNFQRRIFIGVCQLFLLLGWLLKLIDRPLTWKPTIFVHQVPANRTYHS